MHSHPQGFFAPLLLAALCSHALATGGDTPPTAESPAAAVAPTRAGISLTQALGLALARNPELASARLEVQAMEGAELQAGARPNPELGLLVEDTRSASRTVTLQWSQPIELGGKRAARQAAAARAREQAGVMLLARQIDLRAAVASAFFDLLAAQEQVRLTQASLDLVGQATRVAARRLQAGKVPPLEHAKAQLAEAAVRAELAQGQSELLLARQKLASFWGEGQPAFDHAEGQAEQLPDLSTDRGLAELMAQAPAIRLAQLDIARRQALSDSERANRVPDLTLTLGAKRDAEPGRTQALIGLSIPLPFADHRQGQLTEALRREDQARQSLITARLKLQGEVSQAQQKLRLTHQQVQMLRSELLPTAQSTYELALKGYELGRFAFLEVLDAQRTLLQARQHILRGTADAHRAAAELDRLLGREAPQSGHPQE
nr:TolC family protein [uncultured Roseateles sp.]